MTNSKHNQMVRMKVREIITRVENSTATTEEKIIMVRELAALHKLAKR